MRDKYEASGWLTAASMQYGNAHQHTRRDGKVVKFYSPGLRQFKVWIYDPRNSSAGEEFIYFKIGNARRKYRELLDGKTQKHHSPEHRQDIIL